MYFLESARRASAMKLGLAIFKLIIGNKWSRKDKSKINFNDNFKTFTILNLKFLRADFKKINTELVKVITHFFN